MPDIHKRPFDKQKVEEIRTFINANLKNHLNVKLLAQKFGCSESTFRRQFQLSFKKNFRGYLLECRMQKALHLLKEEVTTVNLIACEVGYKSRSSFTHAFSHRFGYPPISLLDDEVPNERK